MEIIPAIDLKGGKCVRLLQGQDNATTEYSDNPVAVAEEWERQGARRLHVVNLDGAFGRPSHNLEIFRAIAERVKASLQYGGGLRSLEQIASAFDAGADKVVMGTTVIEKPDLLVEALACYGGERIIVALDAVKGMVAAHGWQDVTAMSVLSLALRVQELGVNEIIYTDILRDGMMVGTDLSTLQQLCTFGMNVIASGGISSNGDVQALIALHERALTGVIIGKALYEQRVTLPDLLREVASC